MATMRRTAMLMVALALVACGDDRSVPDEQADAAPAPPPSRLARVDAEPAGARCPLGGSAVRRGLDLDRDGVLDDGEIEETSYVCGVAVDDVWTGDVTAAHAGDPAARAALAHARVVTGDVALASAVALATPRLESVVGSVRLEGGARLALPALRTVGGDLVVDGVGAIELPALERVGGGARVGAHTALRAPKLTAIGGTLATPDTAVAVELTLPALQTVEGLTLRGALGAVDLRAVAGIPLGFEAGFTAREARFDALRSIGGDLRVVTGALDLPALETISGWLRVTGGEVVRVPALRSVGGEVDVVSFDLHTLDLSALRLVGGRVFLHTLPKLETLDLRLSLVGRPAPNNAPTQFNVLIEFTGLRELTLSLSNPEDNAVAVMHNGKLEKVTLLGATGRTWLWVSDNSALHTLATGLTRAGFVAITQNPALTNLGLERLSTAEVLKLAGLPMTSLAGLRSLADVEHLSLGYCAQLMSLSGLPDRARIGSLLLHENATLTSLRGLERVALSGLAIEIDDALESLDGLAETTVFTRYLLLKGARRLASLRSLGKLLDVQGELIIRNNPTLTTLKDLDQLRSVGGDVTISENAQVPVDEVNALLDRLGRPRPQ